MPRRPPTHKRRNQLMTDRRRYHMLSHMKRTTLILDPALYADLKRRAAAEGRTLTEVVEHALRLGLGAGASGRRGRVRLPSYDMGPYLLNPAEREGLGLNDEEAET
jgi:hypothetical protein